MNIKKTKMILAFVDDFFFIPKIESRLSKDYHLKIIEDGNFAFDKLIEDFVPSLILIDMNHRALDWAEKIIGLKENIAHQDIPVLLFGSHKDVASFKLAKKIGTDMVVAKSRFVQDMETLVRKLLQE